MSDVARLASIYLKLWKLVDLQFPGHGWLQISDVSPEELEAEARGFLKEDLSWAPDSASLAKDINDTMALLQSKVDPGWIARAQERRAWLQDRALQAAGDLTRLHITEEEKPPAPYVSASRFSMVAAEMMKELALARAEAPIEKPELSAEAYRAFAWEASPSAFDAAKVGGLPEAPEREGPEQGPDLTEDEEDRERKPERY